MAKEDVKIRIPVVPELDRRSTSSLVRDIRSLEKDLGKVNISYKSLAKTSALNIKELRTLSDTASAFGKNLTKSTHDSVKELSRLGKQLDNLSEKAEELEVQISGASDEAEKSKLQDQFAENAKLMQNLNKAIDKQRDQFKKFSGEFGKAIDQQKKFKASLEKTAEYGAKDRARAHAGVMQQLASGNLKGGLKGLMQSSFKSHQGSKARQEIAAGEKMGGAKGAAHMASSGEKLANMAESAAMASAGFAAGAAAVGAFVKLILAASDHMTGLNKAVLQSKGLANEWGVSAEQFDKSLSNLRNAAIGAHAGLLKFGMSSESAMEAVGAFGKEATGSLSKTVSMLKSMGEGDVKSGLLQFSRNAQVYGSALGMTATDTAKLMGTMVSDIGMDSDNVMKTMGDIVKQASQAGMPVHKFMDIFHQAIPNLDLFTNRIEELTGVMKLFSKTMDPRAVKGFMQTMGRGFDGVDFKQRLKMNLMSGGKVAQTMQKDVLKAANNIKNQMPELADAIDQAMQGKRSFADVAAQAMASGKSGAQVASINDLGRYNGLANSGDVLKQTTGMRSMGIMARMKTLEDQAMALHGNKDLAGLGEHVAKMNGISEDEYKSIVALRQSMDTYMSSVNKVGRTSSRSINDNLRKMLRQDKRVADKQFDLDSDSGFEDAMKFIAKQDPGGMEDMIKQAATEQMAQAQDDSEKSKDSLLAMEDLQAMQVNATQSLGDKIDNIIKVLLEKIYFVVHDVFSVLDRIYTMLPGWITGDTTATQKLLSKSTSEALANQANNPRGARLQAETNTKLTEMLRNGADSNKILSSFSSVMTGPSRSKDEAEANKAMLTEALQGILSGGALDEYIDASNKGDVVRTNFFGNKMSADDSALFASRMAAIKARGMAGQSDSIDYGQQSKTADVALQRRAMKQQEMNKVTGDHDDRTEALFSTVGSTTAGSPGASIRNPVSFSRDQKEQTEAQQTTASATEAMADKLNKGVALDQNYTQGKLKTVLKDSSLEALRKALTEQSVLNAVMSQEPEWQRAIAGNAGKFLGAGGTAADIIGMQSTGQGTAAEDMAAFIGARGYATGGPTGSQPHMALMHPSEFVVPKNGALVMKEGGRSGKQVNVGSLTINIQTNNPHEVRQAIDEAFNTGG